MIWQEIYIDALGKGCSETKARQMAQVSKSILTVERLNNPSFAEREQDIYDLVTDELEKEAIRRAQIGVEEPIFYQGQRTDSKIVYSDSLLTFLLKGRRKEVYGDKKEITGGDSPLQITLRDLAKEKNCSIDEVRSLESYKASLATAEVTGDFD